jgi:hypothetical protein
MKNTATEHKVRYFCENPETHNSMRFTRSPKLATMSW